MTSPIVKLSEAPTLVISYPDCSICSVEVESDGDGYICPTCGTSWPYDAGDDTPGTLYEDWSGETLDLPVTDSDEAWQVTIGADRKRKQDLIDASVARAQARQG